MIDRQALVRILRYPLLVAQAAHILITLAVIVAAAIFAFLDRLSDTVEVMDQLVGKRVATWSEISSYSDYLLVKSGGPSKTPNSIVEDLQRRLSERQAEDDKLRESLSRTAGQASWLTFLFPQDMALFRGADISDSIQRFVREIYSTPSSLLEARAAELAPADAIEILSGRALAPLQQRVQALRTIRAKLVAFRSPIEWTVTAFVLFAIWAIWFALVKPSLVQSLELQRKIQSDERRARITLDSIGDAVLVVGSNGRIEAFNPAAEELFKVPSAQAIGRSLTDVVDFRWSNSGRAKATAIVAAPLATRRRTEIVRHMPSGVEQIRVVDLTAAPVAYQGEAEQGQVLVLHDITLEQKLDEQRHINDKARAVVGLAGGLAHEFNNALAIISGAMELTRIKLANSGQPFKLVERHLTAIENAVRQSRALTSQLLAIDSEMKLKLAPISIMAPLSEAVTMLEQSASRSVSVVLDVVLSEQERCVVADASALQRAFVNLGFNSVDAIDGAGSIVVRVRAVSADELDERLHMASRFATRFIRIDWSDTGCGIAEDDLGNIFEPFFTTKTTKGASGLGLSIVRGIIKGHGGLIVVANKPGAGAEFTIVLPMANVNLAADHTSSPTTAPSSTPLFILVAEDEQLFADWLEEVLKSHGHQVIVASDGVQALQLYRDNQQKIDLSVLDLNMPNVNGYEIEKKIRATDPRSKIIVSTGDLAPVVGGSKGLDEKTIVLKKPYSIEDLLGAIARVGA